MSNRVGTSGVLAGGLQFVWAIAVMIWNAILELVTIVPKRIIAVINGAQESNLN